MNNTNKNRTILALLGILVSGIFIYIAFRKVNLSQVISLIAAAKISYLFLSMLVIVSNIFIRSIRWKILLGSEVNSTIGLSEYFKSISVGLMVNNILPFRIGDIAQAVFFTHRNKENTGLIFSTVILKRVIDLMAVITIVVISSFFIFMPQEISRIRIYLSVSVICTVLSVLFALKRKILGLIPNLVKGEKLHKKVEDFTERICYGLDLIKDTRKLIGIIILTMVLWCGYSLGIYFCMLGYGIRIGYLSAIAVMGLTGISALAPFSIASAGVWEVVVILALSIFHIPKSLSLSYAIVYHFISWISAVSLGVSFLIQSGLSISRIENLSSQENKDS